MIFIGVSKFRLLIVLLTFLFLEANAQLYPVQVTPQLVPPYSVYLSDYAAPGSEKLRVIILQRDLTQPSYQLRLVMTIEWNGKVIMRTASAFNPRPLNIDPGIPTVISGADLAPYVDSRNIDFIGYSREQYERTRALPEGSYRIIFTAYDYARQDVQVSNIGSSFYYLSKNEPPQINFPVCGSSIPRKDPPQIVFSWLPRNTASPTSAADTEYEFTLYETRPAGRNPNDVVNTTQPVFRTRTDATTLVYGPTEPILFDEMKYVWRVQAVDKSGRDSFRNNGFSEVCTFTYGGVNAVYDIGVVNTLQAVGETEVRAKIWWEAKDYDGYKVCYRKVGTYAGSSTPYEWFSNNLSAGQAGVPKTELTLFGLEADTEYETRVQVKKSGVFGPFSEIVKFRTLEKQVLECGKETELVRADESKPLLEAYPNMVVYDGSMHLTLVTVKPLGGGWFEGIGTVAPKILGRANFNVKFDRLYVDENLVRGKGRVDFISKGVAELIKQQAVNAINNARQIQQHKNRTQWSGYGFQQEIFKYDEIIISDVQFETDELIITDSKGNTFPNTEIPQLLTDVPEKAIIIEDKNGDQWVIQKDFNGEVKITKVPGGGLVVGPDGKIVMTRELNELDQKILKSLNKYKTAIEDYQASLTEPVPRRGGGPQAFIELPECLKPQEENVGIIHAKLVVLVDSSSSEYFKFSDLIVAKGVDLINAPQEQVDEEVCEELGERILNSFFSGIFLGDQHLEDDQVMYFLSELPEELIFSAKKDKAGTVGDIKVEWRIDSKSLGKNESVKVLIDEQFFEEKIRLTLQATDKVVFGADSSLNIFLERLELRPTILIDSILINIISIQTTFDSLTALIPTLLDPSMDEISLLSDSKYLVRKLTEHLEASVDQSNQKFDAAFRAVYNLDLLMNSVGNFDDILKVTIKLSTDEEKTDFQHGIIQSLQRQNPLGSKASIERNYREQLVNLTYGHLIDLISKE